MTDTCDFAKCKFAKRLRLKSFDECPNYLRTYWTKYGEVEPKKINDCSPKRMLMMVQQISSRLLAIEKSQETQRKTITPLFDAIEEVKNNSQLRLTHEN